MKFSFSTSELKQSERFDYWRDVVCKHCIPAGSHSQFKTNFEATVTGQSIGTLDIATLAAPEHTWERRAEDIRRAPESGIWLSFMESGFGYLEQDGRSVVQNSGDLVLYDASKPFNYTLRPQAFYMVRIPRELLMQRTAAAERLVAISLGTGTALKSVLGSLIKESSLERHFSEFYTAASWGGIAILDLLSCIINLHQGEKPKSNVDALYIRACAYINKHIHCSELSAPDVAAHEKVSLRTLARAFAAHGTTPVRYIWQMRLEASYRAIAEGSVRKVSEAAMNYGFSDFSHFSRAFKKSFGINPRSLMLHRWRIQN